MGHELGTATHGTVEYSRVVDSVASVSICDPTVNIPSECLLLKNMFDPSTENDPDFDVDVREDVIEECSNFGRMNHIYVDRNSAGLVYLRFVKVQAAMGAQRALHGRWFSGRILTATYMTSEAYEAKFREGK